MMTLQLLVTSTFMEKPSKIKVLENWTHFVKRLVHQTWSTNILINLKIIDFNTGKQRSFTSIDKGNRHKQLARVVPRKRCTEKMQKIYRRTLMPKFSLIKVAKQLY